MDYIGPFDQPNNPNASYVNGDADLGIPGSIADARAWENVQREIVAAIKAAGLTPTNTDYTQLTQAIPIIASQVGNAFIITAPITKAVGAGGDFPDLPTAFAWLSQRRIALSGFVTFQLGYGVGANKILQPAGLTTFSHPDGTRVLIKGRPLVGQLPNPSTFPITGTSAQARANDTASALVALRSAFQTELYFTNGASLYVGSGCNIQDVLITSDGIGVGTDCLLIQSNGVYLNRVIAVGAANRGICAGQGAYVVAQGLCGGIGCGGDGVSAELGATVAVQGSLMGLSNGTRGAKALFSSQIVLLGYAGTVFVGRGNAADGAAAVNNSTILLSQYSVLSNNAAAGGSALFTSTIVANGCTADGNVDGFSAYDNSHIDAQTTSGANSRYAFNAWYASDIYRAGTSMTGASATASPAVGTTGNGNATIN